MLHTQPPLPDFTRRIPDFMWIAKDSLSIYPVLVEIEAPEKQWFTKRGQPTSQLTQALNQLTEWKAWFEDHHNQASFIKHYGVQTNGRPLRPRYVLIYGRRSEFEGRADVIAKRAAMQGVDQIFMTFDRLSPDRNASNMITVRRRATGFEAMYVPATFTLGPSLAEPHALVRGKEAAVRRSPHLSPERRKFLVERLPYWDEWAKRGAGGIRNNRDRE